MASLAQTTPQLVHYIPIATTLLSAIFFVILTRRFLERYKMQYFWWALGVFCYGLGTGLEGSITLFGNSVALNKAWYIAGALFGGYPLAQGTVYLLLRKRTAHTLTALSLPVILILSVLVILSPTDMEQLLPHKPGGDALVWQKIRPYTIIVNSYAALFLIGGAILSAVRYARHTSTKNRMIGNSLIALGALLPGIGGAMAKGAIVEGLYIGEFLGLILIWLGYAACIRRPAKESQCEVPVATAK